jgi:hypothetical protein
MFKLLEKGFPAVAPLFEDKRVDLPLLPLKTFLDLVPPVTVCYLVD